MTISSGGHFGVKLYVAKGTPIDVSGVIVITAVAGLAKVLAKESVPLVVTRPVVYVRPFHKTLTVIPPEEIE